MKHDGPVFSASFSPDGKRVVTTSWDNPGLVWMDVWSTIASTEAPKHRSTEAPNAASCGRMNVAARRITANDVYLAKVIAPGRIGEDVCVDITVVPAP